MRRNCGTFFCCDLQGHLILAYGPIDKEFHVLSEQ